MNRERKYESMYHLVHPLMNSPLSRAVKRAMASNRILDAVLTRREGHTPGHAPSARGGLCPKRRAAPRRAAPPPLPPPLSPPPPPTRPVLAAAAGQQTEKRQGQRHLSCWSRPGPRAVAGFGRSRAGLRASGWVQVDLGGSRAPRPCPTTLAAAAAARVTRAAVCRRAFVVGGAPQAEEVASLCFAAWRWWRPAAGVAAAPRQQPAAAAAAVLMSR